MSYKSSSCLEYNIDNDFYSKINKLRYTHGCKATRSKGYRVC